MWNQVLSLWLKLISYYAAKYHPSPTICVTSNKLKANVFKGKISAIVGFSVTFLSTFSNIYFKLIHLKKIVDYNKTDIIYTVKDYYIDLHINVIIHGSNNIISSINVYL